MNKHSHTAAKFEKWLDENAQHLPLSSWGSTHTQIACAFAEHMAKDAAKAAVNRCLDEALNRGDGSYRP